ncbi:hypothetical protein VI03_21515 [Burkholderia vietnamiensis]|uniref:Uncharacterized protein n=3 Tax=Burkholderia cepacia complex TaxID=87882 RepID=A0AA45BC66_BURVI|nr:hypothetical protein WJ35_02385 [Burkholderia ubonensis]AOK10388.1 hypothetical protein WK31_09145 [Burkholderia vietnamiensis]KKI36752.1 hypothetical protein VI03_21515 [Burkholderia vietnamiensis]KVE21772.1 hypothetical protein WI92_23380 [Burkholderia vietnamiensis]KVF07099.1 hypothetical protein WJ04_14190 [Burkholderia vietnamiensis]
MMASLRDPERAMPAIKLHIPTKDVFQFNDDLTAWSVASSVDRRLMRPPQMETTNRESPTLYLAVVDERFFEQYPRWRQFVEH